MIIIRYGPLRNERIASMTKNEGEQRRGRTRDEETEEDTGRRKMGKGDEGEHGAGREERERDVPSLSPPFRNLTYFTSSFPKFPVIPWIRTVGSRVPKRRA